MKRAGWMRAVFVATVAGAVVVGLAEERLYNGIVLPPVWPPRDVDPKNTAPMAVPYLRDPPPVIPIDVGRQLFVDDFLIASNTLRRVFHRPEKYAGNPVLKPVTELELNGEFDDSAVVKGGGLWWDPEKKMFKLWYEAGWLKTVAYATSRDGLHWERPALDVKRGTNQVLPPDLVYDSGNVVPDWSAKDPQQRYKLFFRKPGGNVPGLSLTSPDGIHWTNRVLTGVCGDRSTMFYNPFPKKWVYSLRSSFRGRSRDYRECDDFLAGAEWKDTEPVHWAAVDRDDPKDPAIKRVPQLYNLDAVAYESLMLGIFEIHYGPENDVCEKRGLPKITDLNFAYSRDGFHWDRPDRQAAIASERWYGDAWDRGYVQPLGNLCTVRGDKLWFYYSGFRGDPMKTNQVNQLNGMHQCGSTGIACLRRDGFASLEADDETARSPRGPSLSAGAACSSTSRRRAANCAPKCWTNREGPSRRTRWPHATPCRTTARWPLSHGMARRTCRRCAAGRCASVSRCAGARSTPSGSAATRRAGATAMSRAAGLVSPV